MKDDLYTQNPPLFIALENTKKCKKKFFSCTLLHSLTCWLDPPIKEPFMKERPGVLCQKEPHKPFILEFNVTEGHINNSKSWPQ